MNCIFCNKSVFGNKGVTVPGKGPAHQNCYQANEALRRTFQQLDISALNDDASYLTGESININGGLV